MKLNISDIKITEIKYVLDITVQLLNKGLHQCVSLRARNGKKCCS